MQTNIGLHLAVISLIGISLQSHGEGTEIHRADTIQGNAQAECSVGDSSGMTVAEFHNFILDEKSSQRHIDLKDNVHELGVSYRHLPNQKRDLFALIKNKNTHKVIFYVAGTTKIEGESIEPSVSLSCKETISEESDTGERQCQSIGKYCAPGSTNICCPGLACVPSGSALIGAHKCQLPN